MSAFIEVLAVIGVGYLAWVMLYRLVTGDWSTPVADTDPITTTMDLTGRLDGIDYPAVDDGRWSNTVPRS